MILFTIDDLEKRLYHFPCNSVKMGWVTYSKRWLTEQIRRDYNGKRKWNERQSWNQEEPAVWGIEKSIPYPKEVADYVRETKGQAGGRQLVVMNEAYYDNCYFDIEGKFFRQEKTIFKPDTRKYIENSIAEAVYEKNIQLLLEKTQEILNRHLKELNLEIQSHNNSRKQKYEDLEQRLHVFNYNNYVRQRLTIPPEYVEERKRQKERLLKPIELLCYPKLSKLIEGDKEILLDSDYSSNNPDYQSFDKNKRLQMLADRIQKREKEMIDKYKKVLKQYQDDMDCFYKFLDDLKTSLRNQIEARQEFQNGFLLFETLRNLKLV